MALASGKVLESRTARLGSLIERVQLGDGGIAYRKSGPAHGGDDLGYELMVLDWLDGQLSAPQVYSRHEQGETLVFVLEEKRGIPAHLLSKDRHDEAISRIANFLKELQAFTTKESALLSSPEDDLVIIGRMISNGAIDASAFEARNGQSPSEALDHLEAQYSVIGPFDGPALSHGDLCLPNLIIDDKMDVAGVLDWGLARIASRDRDFVSLEQSITRNFGKQHVGAFYDALGQKPAPEIFAFYDLIDQFFEHQLG